LGNLKKMSLGLILLQMMSIAGLIITGICLGLCRVQSITNLIWIRMIENLRRANMPQRNKRRGK
jgi:hypothetical protein